MKKDKLTEIILVGLGLVFFTWGAGDSIKTALDRRNNSHKKYQLNNSQKLLLVNENLIYTFNTKTKNLEKRLNINKKISNNIQEMYWSKSDKDKIYLNINNIWHYIKDKKLIKTKINKTDFDKKSQYVILNK